MRTLKFRIYDKTEKRMKFLDNIWNMPDPSYDFDEIQQFTGLFDRLGKEVFEGDIIRDGKDGNKFNGRVGVVEFVTKNDEGYPINGWWYRSSADEAGTIDERRAEVIGNIYENGDLLK